MPGTIDHHGTRRTATPNCAESARGSAKQTTALASQTDLELLEGLRNGSEAHFNELYNRYFQRIYSFVYTRTRNHLDAEDIAQETFTVVFRSFESYRGTSSLLSWIYGIAKNTLSNRLRRAKVEGDRLSELPLEALRQVPGLGDCNPEESLRMARYARAVCERMESASGWQSEIFFMRHFENLSIQEISARTNRSSDAVRSSLYRMKRLFFDTLEASTSGLRAAGGDRAV